MKQKHFDATEWSATSQPSSSGRTGATAKSNSTSARAARELDLFEKVARRVCIVAGTAKLPALEGALRGGLITDLIIDDVSATALVS